MLANTVSLTAAEWLDVNYGSLLRELFLGDLRHSVLIDSIGKSSEHSERDIRLTLLVSNRLIAFFGSRSESSWSGGFSESSFQSSRSPAFIFGCGAAAARRQHISALSFFGKPFDLV